MLLAYQDGELTERRARKVSQHLDRCLQCRLELDCLKIEAQHFMAAVAPPLLEAPRLAGGLESLLGKVHKLQAAHREEVQPRIQEHLAFQLKTFFGPRAAALIEDRIAAREDGSGVFSAVEPLFSAFLGQKAADLLASEVVEGLDLSDHPASKPEAVQRPLPVG
jgi:hypothetical protein